MKLEIWCKKSWGLDETQEIDRVLARVVEWPMVPRVGEYIVVWEGWCSEKVLDVHHSFDEDECLIEINPDYSGRYALRNS